MKMTLLFSTLAFTFALMLFGACSSKKKVTDYPQASTPPVMESTTTEVYIPAPEVATHSKDSTRQVANLGASSSGRSR